MSEQEVSPSLSGMNFQKLDGTNYRAWVMRMQDYLQCEGLWCLTIGKEKILEEPKEESKMIGITRRRWTSTGFSSKGLRKRMALSVWR